MEDLAVLLVPTNTSVVRPSSPSPLTLVDNIMPERYVGPARVLLAPGPRPYIVRVQTNDGAVEFELNAEFKRGGRYELHIIDDDEQVAFELFELHPSSYAAFYPHG